MIAFGGKQAAPAGIVGSTVRGLMDEKLWNVIPVTGLSTDSASASDNRTRISAAATEALANLPAIIRFPAGHYPISRGNEILMQPGTGNLIVEGAGGGATQLVFTGEGELSGPWFALAIKPTTAPEHLDVQDYIHNVTIRNIGARDDSPVEHATAEETHGFNIQYCVNAQVYNCAMENTGDEAIELDYVIGGEVYANTLVGCVIADASAGGANISIKNGCRHIKVWGNDIDGQNLGVAGAAGIGIKIIEEASVEDVQIWGNSIRNILVDCIRINATGEAARRVKVWGNTGDGADYAMRRLGSYDVEDVELLDNTWRNVNYGVRIAGLKTRNQRLTLRGNTYDTVSEGDAIFITGQGVSIHERVIRNVQGRAMHVYDADNVTLGCELIEDVCLTSQSPTGAVYHENGNTLDETQSVLEGSILRNCGPRAVNRVSSVRSTRIYGSAQAVDDSLIIDGLHTDGYVTLRRDGSMVRGCRIVNDDDPGSHGVNLPGVSECVIEGNTISLGGSRRAVSETGSCDYNLIVGNNVRGTTLGIHTVGANSVTVNNLEPGA